LPLCVKEKNEPSSFPEPVQVELHADSLKIVLSSVEW
jgi:hypothetical protein